MPTVGSPLSRVWPLSPHLSPECPLSPRLSPECRLFEFAMFCRKLWWTAYGPTRSPRLSPECRLFEFAMFCRKLWWTAYGPTKRLAIEDRIAASSLKLNVHFAKRTGLESYVSQFQMQVKIAEAKYYEGSSFEASTVNAARCSLRILENCSRLLSKSKEVSKRIRNEAELRYVVGNPIMEFICTEGTAKVCLLISHTHTHMYYFNS